MMLYLHLLTYLKKLKMSLQKTAGAIIELKEAKELIKNYKDKNPDKVKAYLVFADLVRQVLDQEGCDGIRIYNGYDVDAGTPNRVLVGVNDKNEDMSEGIILERFYQCPPHVAANTSLSD
jgi:hypothetical protein